MNIQDYWPKDEEVPWNTLESWKHLLAIRKVTALGFREHEQEHGLIPGVIDYSTALGQDFIRLMFFRVIEEYTEYILADSLEHRREELIDSLFFLLEVAVLDEDLHTNLPVLLHKNMKFTGSTLFQVEDSYKLTSRLGGFGNLLRNRTWMKQVQDMYFDRGPLLSLLKDIAQIICHPFSNWEEFWKYYIAKDKVLQFRLRSEY